MSNLLQVCLYNTEPSASAELTKQITGMNFVRLIGEANTPSKLAELLHEPGINLVFFHLDPDPTPVLQVIDEVAARYPEMAMVAISHRTEPETILAPMRAGCEQFVCEPIDAADLANAVGRVSSKRLFVRKKSKCICVVGSSGGAGATSIACNLALEIGHMTDKQCALADLDLQFGDVATNFDWEPKYSIHDLAESIGGLDASVLTSTLSVLQCKVSLLARPQRVEQAEQVTPDVVHRVIELLAFTHEYIVVDVPRRIDGSTTAALGQADVVIVVCQLLVPSIRNAKRLVDTLADGGIPRERMEIVVNRCDSGSGRITTKDVEELIKPVYATIPNDYQFVARSLDFGRPAAALDRNNPVRKAIRGIARKITAEPADETKGQERKGFLDRLLSR